MIEVTYRYLTRRALIAAIEDGTAGIVAESCPDPSTPPWCPDCTS